MDNFKFMVGARADRVCFLRPVPPEVSREDALELAAIIVAMFDHEGRVPLMVEEFRNQ